MFWALFKMILKPFLKTTVKLNTFLQDILTEKNQRFHIRMLSFFFSFYFYAVFWLDTKCSLYSQGAMELLTQCLSAVSLSLLYWVNVRCKVSPSQSTILWQHHTGHVVCITQMNTVQVFCFFVFFFQLDETQKSAVAMCFILEMCIFSRHMGCTGITERIWAGTVPGLLPLFTNISHWPKATCC